MTDSPIETSLFELRRTVQKHLTVYGLGWLIAASLVLMLAIGTADWLVNLSAEIRMILLIASVGLGIWILYGKLIRPLLYPIRDLDLAMRVESRFPLLHNKLTSSVEFLRDPDGTIGSASLKRAVIQDTTRQLQTVDVHSVINPAPMQRSLWAAIGTLSVLAVLILADPLHAKLAAARFFMPFGGTEWPRQTHISVLDPPSVLARGEPLRLIVEVTRGRVPDSAELHMEFADGTTVTKNLRPHGQDQFRGGLDALTQAVDIQVSAGDGFTPVHHIDVVTPPRLSNLDVSLRFPTYTELEDLPLPNGQGNVKAVLGTLVGLKATSNKQLKSATLHLPDKEVRPLTLGLDNVSVSGEFLAEASGSYWVELVDLGGFTNPEPLHYELRVLTDEVPRIQVDDPTSDIQVTPSATVPLLLQVRDDFGVSDTELHYSVLVPNAEPSDTIVLELWSATETKLRQQIEHAWSLDALKLQSGTSVSFHFRARDNNSLTGPGIGTSRELRLLIVSPEELGRQIEDRQLQIFRELERVREMQSDARTRVDALHNSIEHSKQFSQDDAARLQAAESLQRQVERRVSSPTEGLQSLIHRVQQDIANNELEQPDTIQRMNSLEEGIDLVARDFLPALDADLARARKQAQNSDKDLDQVDASLNSALGHQQSTLNEFDRLLALLSKWESYRGVGRAAQELLNKQVEIAEETDEIGQKTIGRKPSELSPEESSRLSDNASNQEQAADDLNRLIQKLQQMSQQLEPSDPNGADNMRRAAQQLQQSGTDQSMRTASDAVRENQVGRAQATQKQVIEQLEQAIQALENNTPTNLEDVLEQLRRAQEKIDELTKKQTEMLDQTRKAEQSRDQKEFDKLAQQQQDLARQVQQMTDLLKRSGAMQASQASAQASQKMQQSQSQLEAGNPQDSQQQQQQAIDQLKKAQQALEQALNQVESELAMQQLAQIGKTLQELKQHQEQAREESQSLAEAVAAKKRWSRPQLATLKKLLEVERAIVAKTKDAKKILTSAAVFRLVLDRTISNLDRIIDAMSDRELDASTLDSQQIVIDRFAQLLEALKNDTANQAAQNQEEGNNEGGSGGSGEGGDQGGIPPIAQLKLLYSLQLEINGRTTILERAENQGRLTDPNRRELKQLSDEQGTIADLFEEMLKAASEGTN